AVNNACYVQNRVLVNKAHNKTPYELFNGRTPAIGFLKPFGCHVMILNTLDNLGKFEPKGDEAYFFGYSMSSKAFRVFNKKTKRVKENVHIEFVENKAIENGSDPNWLFDIDSLTKSMNYVPVVDAEPCNIDAPESSRNSNPTATSTNPLGYQVETLTVESPIPIGSKAEEQTPKALMAIDGVGWYWSYMANDEEDHALDLDNLIESQRSDKSKEGLGYTVVPPPTAQLYLSPKKDLSWTGLPECADDTVTDYSRPSPTVESSSEEDQNKNHFAFENVASPITPKQFVKFVKAIDSQSKSKTDEKETPEKPPVKDTEKYRKPNKKPNVRGNQRNWNNLKSHQLGPDFVMKKKACFKCGDFNHLAYECRKTVSK
nr:ribonuclease H-like domain-containing protein [Tanacetum cinerariifolium]